MKFKVVEYENGVIKVYKAEIKKTKSSETVTGWELLDLTFHNWDQAKHWVEFQKKLTSNPFTVKREEVIEWE